MKFEWDPQKHKINISKHKVAFDEALTVFGDPFADTFNDPENSDYEHRFITIGHSDKNRLLFISHTDDGEIVRIISARETTGAERREYEEG